MHEQADGQKGYTATDGAFVAIPPPAELPDGKIDLDAYRAEARATAARAASRSYEGLFLTLEGVVDNRHVEFPFAPLGIKLYRRIEDLLFKARAHREATAEANADALIDCLASPETAGRFQALLPAVLGFTPPTYANGYASFMERENPWLMRLLDVLPPARLAPALAGGLFSSIFDPYRSIFHEPALKRFLESTHGDLRHLEGNGELIHARFDAGIDIRDYMNFGTVEAMKTAALIRHRLKGIKVDRPPPEPTVSKALGIDLAEGELKSFGTIGIYIERAAHELMLRAPKPERGAFLAYHLRHGGHGLAQVPTAALWPYLAERLDIIDIALGLTDIEDDHGYQPHFAAKLLRQLPATPSRYKDALYRMALGKKRSGRLDAQRLLTGATGLLPRLEKSLNARTRDERLQAALCLGRTGNTQAIPILQTRLTGEKNTEVINAGLTALRTLGTDITAHGPDRAALIEEAKTGLGKPLPEKRAFLADLDLPDLTFADGTPAPLELGPWLVRYAADLGLPSNNELLNLRLAHLSKSSRTALARAALDGWIRNDTLRWDEIAFSTHRALFLPGMYETYLSLHDLGIHWHRHRFVSGKPPKTRAEHARDITEAEIRDFLRGKTTWGVYVNSSYDAKGALALCSALPVGEVQKTLRFYLRHHGGRGPQSKALMSLLASRDGKTPIRELTRIASMQKQKGLRQHAADLLNDLGHAVPAPREPGQPKDRESHSE